MKRLINLFAMILYLLTLQAQTTDSVVNVREHGDQYFLSEPFQDSCMLFDVYEYKNPENDKYGMNYITSDYWYNNSGCGIAVSVMRNTQYMADIAQPFYTDSTLEIIGVSIFTPNRYYLGRNALICVSDSNLNVLRSTPVYDTPIPYFGNENLHQLWLNYDEFFFDNSIDVQGKFYVILDNPKPDSAHNWRNIVLPCENCSNYKMNAGILAASQVVGWATKECPAIMLPLIKRYTLIDSTWSGDTYTAGSIYTNLNATFCKELSDTAWREVTTESYTNLWKHKKVYAYYMFPIFAVHNDTIADSSSVESIAVDNYTFVFPNPASDNITVQCSFRINAIEIFNEQGQKTEELHPNGYNATIDVSKYIKGNYILKIKTQSGSCSKKIVVQ
ncbi:MAG: T9SS type A sorting domain-containing protein [Bacteroidales bacterium]|nr:T9SS type A sorting domain-containing protein [Bacteroidales bacterium]